MFLLFLFTRIRKDKKNDNKECFTVIGESVNFMIIGMSVVFAFLVIMVLVLKAQGKLINYFIASKNDSSTSSISNENEVTDAKKVAIISAAVKHHIEKNSKN